MKKVDSLLKGMLGEDGFITLRKHIFRQDSQTTLTPIDMYLPLLAVPRTVLSWLVQNIHTIPVGEESIIKDVPSLGNIEMHLKRTGNDSYSADFVRDGEILHSFENQTLPMLGGQIIAFTGDYSGALDLSHKVMESAGYEPPETPKIDDSAELRALVRSMGKLIDYLVSQQLGISAPTPLDHRVASLYERRPELEKKAYDPNTAKQGPSGFPLPEGPVGPGEPAKPAKKPQIKINAQVANQNDFKQKTMTKSEYFNSKLCSLKKSNQYFIAEKNIYTKCRQCGVSNFEKSEKGPISKPCACFVDSFNTPFISNLAKSANGYTLQFSKNADAESVEAFIMTLLNKIK